MQINSFTSGIKISSEMRIVMVTMLFDEVTLWWVFHYISKKYLSWRDYWKKLWI